MAKRELTASAVVDHFIARCKAVNGAINAVAVDSSESARSTADKLDKALARGENPGPLVGLPVTIKECFDISGTATTLTWTAVAPRHIENAGRRLRRGTAWRRSNSDRQN
ncbi:MAG: amidase family protein [Pseudolabrys sp.]